MKKDVYILPATFCFDTDGISVQFPNLQGCFTWANTIEEASKNAKEAMALHLIGMEEDNIDVFQTPITDIKLEPNEVIMLIEVYMPLYRDAVKNASVKKTLTIPRWLNVLGEENHVNFSQLLQSALKEVLGVKR